MKITELHINPNQLSGICLRHGVSKLEVFGSFAKKRAGRNSDVDLLVTFQPGAKGGVGFDFIALAHELKDLFGRPVDLLTRRSVEQSPNKYFRHFVLKTAESIYDAS